eukprot:208740-Chlamydomonas_euryale.AAC.1
MHARAWTPYHHGASQHTEGCEKYRPEGSMFVMSTVVAEAGSGSSSSSTTEIATSSVTSSVGVNDIVRCTGLHAPPAKYVTAPEA